jgi:hypothetical protein
MATIRTRGQLYTSGGANVLHVAPDDLVTIVLDPDDADAANAATERWTDTTGAVAFRVIPIGAASAVGSLESIIFGWSQTASDLAAVNARMATLDTGVAAAGSGGSEVVGVGIILPVKRADGSTGWVGNTDWITPPDGKTIKTSAVRSGGADYTAGVVLQLIRYEVG